MRTTLNISIKTIVLGFLSMLILACGGNQGGDTVSVDPSEKSELAALMRVMEQHGDEVRRALRAGTELPARPVGIKGLLTAEATPRMNIDQGTFPVFVQQYQESIEALYVASQDERQGAYNAVIQSCSNCHTINCPGPLMKIEKMFIEGKVIIGP